MEQKADRILGVWYSTCSKAVIFYPKAVHRNSEILRPPFCAQRSGRRKD